MGLQYVENETVPGLSQLFHVRFQTDIFAPTQFI